MAISKHRKQAAAIMQRVDDLLHGRHPDAGPDFDLRGALLRELRKLPQERTMPLAPRLNNFHARLPGGDMRHWDDDILRTKRDDPGYSRRRRARSRAEFYEDIDRAIIEVGLDPKEILRLRANNSGALDHYIKPLYMRLRQKGHKRYPDLVA